MYKKTKCLIIVDEGELQISGEDEPCFVKEITELFRGKLINNSVIVKEEFKDQVIDIAQDYFYEITFIGDSREKFKGKHYVD